MAFHLSGLSCGHDHVNLNSSFFGECVNGSNAALRFDCVLLNKKRKFANETTEKIVQNRNEPKTFTFRSGYKRGACDVRIHLENIITTSN